MTDHHDQESDTMTEPQTKTEWLADIAVESHRTNELLTEIRDRLPEPEGVKGEPDPAPADALPGEPVEPGDPRAGDRVAFTWEVTGERICTLVSIPPDSALISGTPSWSDCRPNVAFRGEWRHDISDVRLIERAPREDEDRDEALARVICKASGDSWIVNGTDYLPAARAAREHISRNQPVDASPLLERECEQQRVRAEKAEADLSRRGELLAWTQTDRDAAERRAVKAEAERDGWKAKHGIALANQEAADEALGEELARSQALEAKYTALREDVEALRRNPKSLTDVLMRAADALNRDDDRTPQADPDAVTLRRDDVEALLSQWEDRGYHETEEGVDPLYSRVRAALGWGDSDDA